MRQRCNGATRHDDDHSKHPSYLPTLGLRRHPGSFERRVYGPKSCVSASAVGLQVCYTPGALWPQRRRRNCGVNCQSVGFHLMDVQLHRISPCSFYSYSSDDRLFRTRNEKRLLDMPIRRERKRDETGTEDSLRRRWIKEDGGGRQVKSMMVGVNCH